MLTIDADDTSRPRASTHVSAPLTLAIAGISDGDARVTPPAVRQANDFVIDLGDFEGDAEVTVTAWPLMAIGQTWRLFARPSSGADLPIANGTVDQVASFSRPLGRTWLGTLPDNTTLTLVLGIRYGTSAESLFQSPAYTIVAVAPLVLDGPASAYVSDPFQFTATGGKPPYAYASNDPTIAIINAADGNGQAIAAGTATITVTDSGQPAQHAPESLTVTLGPLIELGDRPEHLDVGETFQLKVSGGTLPYEYLSSNPAAASVSASGLIRGLANGFASITVGDSRIPYQVSWELHVPRHR